MPPQTNLQANLTAEIVRDAARLGLDHPVDAATNAVRSAPAAPRPAPSVAVPRDAVSEKDAAGPPGGAAPGLLGWLRRYWCAVQESRMRRRMRLDLADLSEAQLKDIGCSRTDIDHIAAHRALQRLKESTAYLMTSRGLM
ncbi:DUF1127 domain-containing protein [Bradyrhizobium oligotrophicum]|uniref:DUF1127 domain-containing protein n=1 Tax=Bradyrhizobium oligotrophicum TaxID=44255 RepID=UPI003EB9714B